MDVEDVTPKENAMMHDNRTRLRKVWAGSRIHILVPQLLLAQVREYLFFTGRCPARITSLDNLENKKKRKKNSVSQRNMRRREYFFVINAGTDLSKIIVQYR